MTTREAAWYSVDSVSVCQTITFESLDVGSSYLHILYISRVKCVYEGHRVKVMVTGPKKGPQQVHTQRMLRVTTNLLPRSVKIPITRRQQLTER